MTVALATNRVFPLLLALKWLLAGAFLTWLFRRQLHEDEVTASLVTSVGPEAFDVEAKLRRWLALPGDADVFAAVGMLPPEEQERIAGRMREELERDLAAARARSKDLNRRALRAFATGGVLLLAGMALYMTSALTKAKVDAAQTQPR